MCVYYDLVELGYSVFFHWWILIVFIVFGGVLAWKGYGRLRMMGVVMFGFCLVAGIVNVRFDLKDYRQIRQAYDAESFEIVKGTIGEFESGIDEQPDRFVVDGVLFEVFAYNGWLGFKEVRHQGSPLMNGQNVVIWHVNGMIVHLEIEC
jgi:hypothetical protein